MKTITRIGAIIIQNKQILLVKGKKHIELWTPGGKIEENESDEECLRRELNEEIGVNLISMKFFIKVTKKSPYHEHNTKSKLYFAQIQGEIKPNNEIEKFYWYTKEDFLNNKFPMIPTYQEVVIPLLIEKGLL